MPKKKMTGSQKSAAKAVKHIYGDSDFGMMSDYTRSLQEMSKPASKRNKVLPKKKPKL